MTDEGKAREVLEGVVVTPRGVVKLDERVRQIEAWWAEVPAVTRKLRLYSYIGILLAEITALRARQGKRTDGA